MKLSRRLQTIIDMIPEGVRVIDVGCDHAFLDIYLTLKGTNRCIASDINENVLKKTKEMIESYQLLDKIQIVRSDGLKEIEVKQDDFVVIAGMGTSTILRILSEKEITQVIIQSNNDLEELRRKLSDNYGFLIVDEQVVFEKNLYYVIMKIQKGNVRYSDKECQLGPILISKRDSLTKSYFEALLKKKKKILDALPIDCEEQKKFMVEISYLKEVLKG
ncbi:MAG: SAM-dependent methyltransferase [Bacilli bacterium]|jgi:tRNA (adenine22-N1)-methyltransferase|nr:SAM-dependent methyltransferase [Bacilli bacterium]